MLYIIGSIIFWTIIPFVFETIENKIKAGNAIADLSETNKQKAFESLLIKNTK